VAEVDPLAPNPRLDAESALAAVNATVAEPLVLLEAAHGGEIGAAFVRWPDGHQGVLTVASSAAAARKATVPLDVARARGLPVPRYELIVPTCDAAALVQQRLSGSPPDQVNLKLVRAMVDLVDRFADLLVGRDDVDVPDLYLRHSGPGYSVHDSLARYNNRSRALLRWIHSVGEQRPTPMCGWDLLHLDLQPSNVLVDDDGTITGIVDWDGIGRGDRRFCLVTMRFAVMQQGAADGVCEWLDDTLAKRIEADVLRGYWAAMSLRQVDWAIRHHQAGDVEAVLTLAESGMD